MQPFAPVIQETHPVSTRQYSATGTVFNNTKQKLLEFGSKCKEKHGAVTGAVFFFVLCDIARKRYIIFTSIVTPEGSVRFVRASTTFGDGERISISRLWIRISNCSRAFL